MVKKTFVSLLGNACAGNVPELVRVYLAALKAFEGEVTKDDAGKEHVYKFNEDDEAEIASKLRELIETKLPFHLSLIGIWIWITETEKAMAPMLKSLKCFWAPQKQAWYYRPARMKCYHSRGGTRFNSMALRYGCKEFENANA
jgi:hypothetical protein